MNEDTFNTWLQRLGKAWVDRNPKILGEICADNVIYHESPFGEPLKGKAAVIAEWESVPASQKDISYEFDIITVTEKCGIAHWTATFTRVPSNVTDTLDGIFQVTLNDKGLCTNFRMWWVVKPR